MASAPIGFRIYTHTPRPSAEVLAGFRDVPTGHICDAMDRLSAMEPQIRPLSPQLHLSGPALTVRTRPGDNLMVWKALDVAKPGDVLVIATYGHTTVSTFHLRAFLSEHPIAGVDEAWLRDAITRRGGRVIDSDLPVPAPLAPALAHSLRNQWQHWFAGDVLTLQPGNPALEDHLSRYRWCSTPLAELNDARVAAVVKALFEPVVRDYGEAAKVRAPHELKGVEVTHRPQLEGAVHALVSRDIVKPNGDGFEWGANAAQLSEFRRACEWRASK
jgi:hypothetical protein